jgi:hypothetical protein
MALLPTAAPALAILNTISRWRRDNFHDPSADRPAIARWLADVGNAHASYTTNCIESKGEREPGFTSEYLRLRRRLLTAVNHSREIDDSALDRFASIVCTRVDCSHIQEIGAITIPSARPPTR